MANRVIEEDDDQILKETMTSDARSGYIKVDGWCLGNRYKEFADAIENLEVRDDDVWICSFPKTGSTWSVEMVWCIGHDVDLETAKKILWNIRVPFLEFGTLFDYSKISSNVPEFKDFIPDSLSNSVNHANTLPSPRFMKSHLPFDLLPRQIRTGERKPKIVYVMRNPKDTCISYYYQCHNFEYYTGTMEQFFTLFLNGKPIYGPYWKHILSYWNKRDLENLLIIKYEDMKKDLPSVIKATANFLGKQLTEENVKTLTHHLSFESMKANPMVNYEDIISNLQKFKLTHDDVKFMRSGKVDQWKEGMSSDVIEKFDKMTEKYFKGTGLPY